MKRALISLFAIFIAFISLAQDNNPYVVVSYFKLNDLTPDQWETVNAANKEYMSKLVVPNKDVVSQNGLMHFYTPDNRDFVIMTEYKDWASIDKSGATQDELAKKNWPDEKKRRELFRQSNMMFDNNAGHSDEIYQEYKQFRKVNNNKPQGDDKPNVFVFQRHKLNFPENGTNAELISLLESHYKNVVMKSDKIKSYRVLQHAYGSKGTEIVEVMEFASLADLEAYNEGIADLEKKAMPDEKAREEYYKKVNGYLTGHSDYIYREANGMRK